MSHAICRTKITLGGSNRQVSEDKNGIRNRPAGGDAERVGEPPGEQESQLGIPRARRRRPARVAAAFSASLCFVLGKVQIRGSAVFCVYLIGPITKVWPYRPIRSRHYCWSPRPRSCTESPGGKINWPCETIHWSYSIQFCWVILVTV
jgi:hypothetical protein